MSTARTNGHTLTVSSAKSRPWSRMTTSSARARSRELVRVEVERVPPLPVPRDPPERGVAVAADVDRRVRLLHRLRERARRREVVPAVVVLGHVVDPQRPHDLEVAVGEPAAILAAELERLELLADPPDADAEVEATARQVVDRRRLLRREQRLALGDQRHPGAEPERRRARGQEAERDERVEHAGTPAEHRRAPARCLTVEGDDVLRHPHRVEAPLLGRRAERAQRLRRRARCRRRREEPDLHGADCIRTPESA